MQSNTQLQVADREAGTDMGNRFQSKPQAVVASQWFKEGDHRAAVKMLAGPEGEERYTPQMAKAWGEMASIFHAVHTSRGYQQVNAGDWIVTDGGGRSHVLSPEAFERAYEPARQDAGPGSAVDTEGNDPAGSLLQALRAVAEVVRVSAREEKTSCGLAVSVGELQTVLGGAADELDGIIARLAGGSQDDWSGPAEELRALIDGWTQAWQIPADAQIVKALSRAIDENRGEHSPAVMDALREIVAVLGPNIPSSVVDQGARWEWGHALDTARRALAGQGPGKPAVQTGAGATQEVKIDNETIYLGVLWRHGAACFREDEQAQEQWAEMADEYHKLTGGNPADYKDGARWLASCVAQWPVDGQGKKEDQ